MSTHPSASDGTTHIDYSVVVPVYRGRETIDALCERLVAFFRTRGVNYEVILVDDDSSDGSWRRIEEIARRFTEVRGLRLMRNFGQHNATNCGLSASRGEFVITLDEDLQHPPEEIEKLIECQRRDDADVVYGCAIERKHSWWRRLGSRLAMRIPRYVMKVDFDISTFRLMRRSVVKVVAASVRHDVVIDVYIGWATRRITATPVAHVAARPSGYSPYKLALAMFNLLCNYTVAPLRIATATGAMIATASFALAGYFMWRKMAYGIDMPGFAATIVTLLFSTGLLLLAIGIVSEYLARIFLYINRKPQWVLRETTGGDGDDDANCG